MRKVERGHAEHRIEAKEVRDAAAGLERVEARLDGRQRERDEEVEAEVDDGGDGERVGARAQREDLGDDQPGDGPEADLR